MRVALVVAGLLGIVSDAAATAPETSLRPNPRLTVAVMIDEFKSLRPVTRPGVAVEDPLPAATVQSVAFLPGASSLRPLLRPPEVEQRAMARRRARARGAVCRDTDIQGNEVGAVPGRITGCGIRDAVRIREVSGVSLSQEALMDCTTAKALNRWVRQSAKPALKGIGGGLTRLRVAAHYACRTRNNQRGARISEHGKGRAIDISGFTLANGSQITVLKGWGAGREGRALRKMHKGACGPFGTVLGPNSDRFHRDHFHFDTAKYRSGPYCR